MFGTGRYLAKVYFAERYFPKKGEAAIAPPVGERYLDLAHGDTNTAILLYLNDYYNVSEDDLSTVLSRFLHEGSYHDSTRQWRLLFEAISSPGVNAVNVLVGDDIQALVDANPVNTTFLIATGTHRLQSIVPKNGQTFIGEDGAILSGARILTGWAADGANYKVEGQTQAGTVHSEAVLLAAYPRADHPEDLWIDGVVATHVEEIGDLAAGKWFFDYDTDTIYIRDDPSGKTILTSVIPHAFSGSASGVTLENLIIERHANTAQTGAIQGVDGTDWIVRDCTVRYNHAGGIETGDGMLIDGGRVHNNYEIGLRAGVSSHAGIVVDGVEIDHNNLFFDWAWEGGGTKFAFTVGLQFKNCYSHDNDGMGVWCDIDNVNSTIEDCIFTGNSYAGVFIEISYGATIRRNDIHDNGTWTDNYYTSGPGILISASSDCHVYENDVENNGVGILAIQQDRGSGGHGPYLVQNLSVHDNNVAQSGGQLGFAGLVTDTGSKAPYLSRNNHFEDNTYGGTNPIKYFTWDDEGFLEYAQWQAYGHDDGM